MKLENNTALDISQTNVLNAENNKDYSSIENNNLVETEPIKGTPFTIVKAKTDNGEKWFTSIGNNRVTPLYNNQEDCLAEIHGKDWNLIVSLITIITERVHEQIKMEDKARNELAHQPDHSKL